MYNTTREKARIKYKEMIKILEAGKQEYMSNARTISLKICQDMYLNGADDCLQRIKMIKMFLTDLNEIEVEENQGESTFDRGKRTNDD